MAAFEKEGRNFFIVGFTRNTVYPQVHVHLMQHGIADTITCCTAVLSSAEPNTKCGDTVADEMGRRAGRGEIGDATSDGRKRWDD